MTPASEAIPAARPLEPGEIVHALWQIAIEALVRAWLVLLLGGIAVGLVGGIFSEMTPSRPPGMAGSLVAATTGARFWGDGWSVIQRHRFGILFALFFILGSWTRLAGKSAQGKPTRTRRAFQHLAENWFWLIVGNAFGAMIAVTIFAWAQQFSWTQLLMRWVFEQIGALWQPQPGAESTGNSTLDPWHWYSANGGRSAFWFFYLTAICDDLGLPNLKTLARWLWRRLRRSYRPRPERAPTS
jgi:hypothetical protein